MKIVEKEIEEWIRPYATIVSTPPDVDIALRQIHSTRYFLQLSMPDIFESYVIALHSFWINYKVPQEEIQERGDNSSEFPEADFDRVNWKNFYVRKKQRFDLRNLCREPYTFYDQFTMMNNELYAAEGLMDQEHLRSLSEIVMKLYGDQKIEVFYPFLYTAEWEGNKIYQGKISSLTELLEDGGLLLTPALIYPVTRSWVVNTDNDLPFSFIGGERRFIRELIDENEDEIYELEY